jgi:hypothetical protein
MIALALYFATVVSQWSAPHCEEFGPRLDGTFVTVCDGAMVAVRDQLGNSREWNRAAGTITVRSAGREPMVLTRDGR